MLIKIKKKVRKRMEFLKNNPKWIRQPKQVQISEDKVVILTERGIKSLGIYEISIPVC